MDQNGSTWPNGSELTRSCSFSTVFSLLVIKQHKLVYFFCNGVSDFLQVTLVELSKSSPSLPEILSGIGSSVIGIDTTLKQLMDGLTFSDGVQARMDGIMFQRSEGSSFANPIFNLLKDYLSSL